MAKARRGGGAAIGSRVVEGAAMMERDAAGGHLHGHRFGHLVTLLPHHVDDAVPCHVELD